MTNGLTIGAFAKSVGVRADTIRYYERHGLLADPGRTAAGYRIYDARDVERVRFIRKGKHLGFTLKEIGTYRTLSHEESDHTIAGIPAHRVTATAGGGQEPTQQVSVIVLDTESAHTTVVIAVADTDDGEGMRATQEALDTLVATTP